MKRIDLRWPERTYDDALAVFRRRLLYLSLPALIAASLLGSITSLYFWRVGKLAGPYPVAGIAALAALLLAYGLGRKGSLLTAAWIVVMVVFLASAFAGYQSGAGHAIYIGYAISSLAAGLLVSPLSGLLVALLGAGGQIFFPSLQAAGGISRSPSLPATSFSDALMSGIGLVALVAISSVITGEIEKSVAREKHMAYGVNQAHKDLERQIARRTDDLHRRLVQIRTAAEISRSISSVLEPQVLLDQVASLIKTGFSQYYVGVFLLDDPRQYAVLRAGTGEPGRRMMAAGHRLAVGGESMIGQAVYTGKARIAQDVGQERLRFNNPHLPWTRSELALPILAGDHVLGAISVQSEYIQAFDQDDLLVLQGIADSLGIALENARLFTQSQESLSEVRSLHRQYLEQAWSQVVDQPGPFTYTYEEARNDSSDGEGHPAQIDIPLVLRDQEIGRLSVEGDQREWTDEERSLVASITAQAALALENARLMDENRRKAENERLINQFAASTGRSLDLETVLRTAAIELGAVTGAERVQIRIGTPSVSLTPGTEDIHAGRPE